MRSRAVSLFLIATFVAAGTIALAEPNERLELVTSERLPFAENGMIELHDSSGEVRVEGWDRKEVEITVRRCTRRSFPASLHADLRNQLDQVRIHSLRRGATRLVISTEFPFRGVFSRAPHHRNEIDLEYIIKAPIHTNLTIRHNDGGVQVINVTGSADISGNTGEITLLLPAYERFVVDARCKMGDVRSDFTADARRPFLVGGRWNEPVPDAHRLFLRMGEGGINIRRMTDSRM